MNSQKYCMYCMAPKHADTDVCPLCQHSSSEVRSKTYQLPAGTVLNGRYVVGRVLGSGGFGITYVGRDLNLDMKIAIKEYYPTGFSNRNTQIAPALIPDEDAVELFIEGKARFLREARIMAKFVEEKNIVGVRDFFEANNTCYIVMDFISGISLKDYLVSAKQLSVEQTLKLLLPVMESLACVHKEGMIHRDISPDNIMLTDKGQVKLLDFGAARDVIGNSKTATVILKEGYAPVEQYSGKGDLGPWTDIYALAATMYRCITGKIPPAAIERLSGENLVLPSSMGIEISEQIEQAIMTGLAIFKDRRFQNIEAFQRALTFDEVTQQIVNTPQESEIHAQNVSTEPQTQQGQTMLQEDMSVRSMLQYNPTPDMPVYGDNNASGTPVSYEQPKKPVKKEKKEKKPKKKRRIGLKIFAGAGAVVIAAVVAFVIYGLTATINIGGKSFDKSENYVTVFAGKVTTDQLNDIHKLRNLTNLTLNNCFLTDNEVQIIADELKQLPEDDRKLCINLSSNPEITDISPLAEVANISELLVGGCAVSDFSSFEGHGKLIRLTIDQMEVAIETDSLKNLTQLQSLIVDNNNLTSLEFMADMAELSLVSAANNQLTSIKGLENKERLSHVQIYNNQITDIEPLRDAVALWEIDMSKNQISDISPLANKEIRISISMSDNLITDLSPLAGFFNGYNLEANNNQIKDLSPLSEMYGLSYVELSGNQIEDVTALNRLQEMTHLDLSHNQISDVSALELMENLRWLYINNNAIKDISMLGALTQLETLNISHNQIEDIKVIGNYPLLEHMYLDNNQISDISPLATIDGSVYGGDLSRNQIVDFSPLYDTKMEQTLYIYGNPITDVTFVQKMKFADYSHLVLSYNEAIDWTQLYSADDSLSRVTVVDTPEDKKYDVEHTCPITVYFESIQKFIQEELLDSDE